MKLAGQQILPASQDVVWRALLDPDVLSRTLPGCESLDPADPDAYRMRMKLAIASVQGLFDGKVSITEQDPPHCYRLNVEGRGKIGFVNGGGVLRLEPSGSGGDSPATLVHYEGEVKVGGMIASVGQRLLDMTSKMMIRRFFSALTSEIAAGAGAL